MADGDGGREASRGAVGYWSGDVLIAEYVEAAPISVEIDVIDGDSAVNFLKVDGIGGDLDGIRDGSEMS